MQARLLFTKEVDKMLKRKGKLVLTILFLHALHPIHSQSNYKSFEDNSDSVKRIFPTRNIIQENKNFLEFSYDFSEFEINSIVENGQTYQTIAIPGFSPMQEVGKPSVPVKTEIIAIPSHAIPKITILYSENQIIPNIRIFPAQKPEIDSKPSIQNSFAFDKMAYQSNSVFPVNVAEILDVQVLRGNKLVYLQIRPVQYMAKSNSIKVYSKLRIRVDFEGLNNSFTDYSKNQTDESLKILRNIVLNSHSIPKSVKQSFKINGKEKTGLLPENINESKDYIIITTTSYKAAADSLAKWKMQMGYKVDIVTKTAWDTISVRDSISIRYQNWNPKPGYLLIIGDNADVPALIRPVYLSPSNSFYTDMFYACMDGTNDMMPDMARGRISVNSASQAMDVVKKIINYERFPVNDASFYSSALSTGEFQDADFNGYDDRRFLHTNEEIRNYLISKGYNNQRLYNVNTNINPLFYNNGKYSPVNFAIPNELLKSSGFLWNATGNDVVSSLNSGKFLVFHRGHGLSTGNGWVKPDFTTTNVTSLSNSNKLPVIFSIECYSGKFNDTECFSEKLLRSNTGGAAAVISASYYSFSGSNDALIAGLADAIWSSPGLVPVFGSGGVYNPTLNNHNDIITLGNIMDQGLIRMTTTWSDVSSTFQYQYQIYHLFGDPAMKIWTSAPVKLTATVPTTIIRSGTSLSISNSNCSNAIATLVANGVLLGKVQLVNGSGNIAYNLSDSVLATITISGRNFMPMISDVILNNKIYAQPVVQAKNVKAVKNSSSKNISFNVSWTNGNGEYRLVKISSSPVFTMPQDGQDYIGNPSYNGTGEQIIYSGKDSVVQVDGLSETSTYWIRVFEFNNNGSVTRYSINTDVQNPTFTDGGGVLPIGLLSFTAVRNKSDILINWETATELNNDYFSIEKSEHGDNFQTIAIIAGAGNSNSKKIYTYSDKNNSKQALFYRLKQTDFDGNFSYSETVALGSVSSGLEILYSELNSSGLLNLNLHGFQPGNIDIRIFDQNGKIVFEKIIDSNSGMDYQHFSLLTPVLKQAIYLLQVKQGNKQISKKLMSQR